MKSLTKFNDRLAEKLSYSLSTMTTFYVVSMLVTVPLLYSTPTSVVGWSQYLCSVIFQGIALPVLGYTAKKASDQSDKLMMNMYRMTEEIDKLVKKLESNQVHMHKEIDQILEIEKTDSTQKKTKPSASLKPQPKRQKSQGFSRP